MTTVEPLDSHLAALRADLAGVHPPAALEGALVARFAAARGRRPPLWWMPPLALAATVAMVSWTIRAPLPQLPAQPLVAPVDPGPFLALRPRERNAREPPACVVGTQLPRAQRAAWGRPGAPPRAHEPVGAALLYSAEGEALAVRIIR
jgi:hypothetical protein